MATSESHRQILDKYKIFIDDLINEGESEKDIVSEVVGNIAINVYDLSKSILVLEENSQYAGLDTLMRLVVERYVYIAYILKDDSFRRANAYKLNYFFAQKNLIDNLLSSDKINGEESRLDDRNVVSYEEYFKTQFDPYEKEYNSLYPHKLNKYWYNNDNKTPNFYKLCKKLGLLEEYNFIFRVTSLEVHAIIGLKHFSYDRYAKDAKIEMTGYLDGIDSIVIPTLEKIMKALNNYFVTEQK